MFITLLVLLVFTVAITVGINSLKDKAQDSVKFQRRINDLESFSTLCCLILFILIVWLWWKIPTSSVQAADPPFMKDPAACETPSAVISPKVILTATAIVATPTAVVEEKNTGFGGVLIKNPSKQWLSIKMWDQDKDMYIPYKMTNNHGEEVKMNRDEEYFLEAADAETYFEGYVQVGDQKYDFVFDHEKDGKSVKELGI